MEQQVLWHQEDFQVKQTILAVTFNRSVICQKNLMLGIRRLRQLMRFQNEYWIVAIVLSSLLVSQMSFAKTNDISGQVAFVSITTTQLKGPLGSPEAFAPHVLLRFTKQGTSASFLAMTDKLGVTVIPVEAGKYCVQAYGLDGRVARLSTKSSKALHRCFIAIPNRMVEFSVTLAEDVVYSGEVPSLPID